MPEVTDWAADPEFEQWERQIADRLVPMLDRSAVSVSLVTGRVDVKFAVELGLSIMLDKPIIAVVYPGAQVSAKLLAVADHVVEGGDQEALMGALNDVVAGLDAKAGGDE